MTLLIDYSQVVIATTMGLQSSKNTRQEFNQNFIRTVVLNNIKNLRLKHGRHHEVVLCCDAKSYWRKDVFPYYKANRAKLKQDTSIIDWNLFFEFNDVMKQEIRACLPYKLLEVEHCEADDIIGTLSRHITEDFDAQPVIIVSADSDFNQLLSYRMVSQYNNIKRSMAKVASPGMFLKEKIIRGDTGDGIPNVLSDDDTLVNPDKRQGKLTKKIFEDLMNKDVSEYPEHIRIRYDRNNKLINLLEQIPTKYQESIIQAYTDMKPVKGRVFNYLFENNLNLLMTNPAGLE